jgi:hypothetical protein
MVRQIGAEHNDVTGKHCPKERFTEIYNEFLAEAHDWYLLCINTPYERIDREAWRLEKSK